MQPVSLDADTARVQRSNNRRLQRRKPAAAENGFKGKISWMSAIPPGTGRRYTPKKAPRGAPNFLFILYDDTGLAAWSPYGGRISTCSSRPAG